MTYQSAQAALDLAEHAKAIKGFSSSVSDSLNLSGIYTGVCRGYRDTHKAEYLAEHPRLLAMRAKRDRFLKYGAVLGLAFFAGFLEELEKFEAYMSSLTEIKWADQAPNIVTTLGANLALDNGPLQASAYTSVGPFMFLIGAVTFTSAPVIADTMTSHAGWTEAGTTNAPTYTGPRKTIAWSAATAKTKAPSSAPIFAFTGAGTAKGVGLCLHTGAVSTIDSTAGLLYSAGLFSGGDQAVVNTNTVSVTYSANA